MNAAASALSPQAYAELSALYDELSDLPPAAQASRMAALRSSSHPLAERLARMLAAIHGPRTDELLPRLAPPALSAEAGTGQRIGPWLLLHPLGSGGMAEVWLANRADGGLKREVALKLPYRLPGTSGAARAMRFARERDILAALRHPHIAALLDAGVEPDGRAWLALERVDGERITDWCDSRRVPLKQRIALFRQILLAVQHAHAQLVIHRDIKPANVLVTAGGEVRLLDFGIAKLLADADGAVDDTALTQQAGRPLTPRYASPEQLRGEALSTASDVYALGVLLHELLTGRLPYTLAHGGAAELERAITEGDMPLPSKALPEAAAAAARSTTPRALQRALAPELDAVLLRTLARLPADRYRSVDALLADIDRWCAGVPVLARTPGVWFRLRRFAARHPLGMGTGAAVAAGLLGLSITATVLGLKAHQESQRATLSRDFLLDVFSKADTDASRGAEISAREMLDWGRKRAAALQAEPGLRAELLIDIGKAQRDATDYTGAASSFDEAARLLRVAGRSDALVLAEGFRTELALRQGDLPAAALHLAAAQAAMPMQAAVDLQARVLELQGWHALAQGDAKAAMALDEQAAQAARLAWPISDERRVLIELQRARSTAAAGQAPQALALLDTLAAQRGGDTGADPHVLANIEFARAVVQHGLGQYGSIATQLRVALPRCERAVGPATEWCGKLRRLHALALLRTGHVAQAEQLLPAIEAEAAATRSASRRVEALLIWGRIVASSAVVDDARSPWPELRLVASGQGSVPLPHQLRALAQQVLAEAALRSGRAAAAMHWVDSSLATIAQAPAPMPTLALHATALSAAALWLDGDPQQAIQTWQQAHVEASVLLGPDHPMTWTYAINQVPALQATGQHQQAQALLRRGLPVLEQALGANSAISQRVAGWQREPTRAALPATASGALL